MKYAVITSEIVLLVVTIIILALFVSIYPITVPGKPVFASPDTATFRPNTAGTYQEWTIFVGSPTRWRATGDQNDATDVQVMVRRVR